ncbi:MULTISPECIES: sugar ABC transporter substrate-binding protein [unclassified Streptomyces]|uniref:ABC transporter substrate-binding protein n=1 Tax=unclassified Streptomyces TaxID=2593676 RepID=UPI000DBA95CC|nr:MULTISPECIES: sugar ABC transporter substrate-binding protein [unclassified Streptomyces]MYT73713.1 extracellular solute-binding protein [Streptomyces sp. SID8367]RAJ85254.1 multiple sugar transport system substrate-binding protein [Streptomyces sp. PsTaAH-137]
MPGRQSRRSMLAAITALPLTGALGACSGSDSASPQSSSKTGTKGSRGTTTITFWSALRGSQEVVDEFNRTHDHIQVRFEQIPSGNAGGYLKLSNAARAGNAPDVATIEYPQVPGFAIDGVARDITSLISDDLRKKLLPQALGQTTFEGRTFSVPLDVEPTVLHYRKDLFDKYGFEVPVTWDAYADLARAVRRTGGKRKVCIFSLDMGLYSGLCWQAGAQWFDTSKGAWNVSLADAPTRRVSTYWQRLIDEDLVYANNPNSRANDAQIGNGLVLTRHSGAWDAGAQMNARPEQKGLWRIAPQPQWDPDRPALGTNGGSTFAVTKDSAHPEAAMEFIEWQVSSPDALKARLSSGASSQYPAVSELIPVGRAAFDRTYYGGQDIYTLFEQEAHKIRDGWVWGPRMTATASVMQDAFTRAAAGSGTLESSMRATQVGTMPDLKALGLRTTQHTT